ncbi:hypothetical protein [Pseudomonas prosekii]|uniref:hypothetical protein n=1 Tax=Pseudomonas prosekii TaxID=1148509 RepID=UPI00215B053F|nr:hypothetical protein [Pseudomonas prosekii]
MNIKALVAYGLIAGLTGCASNSVPLTENETIVHIKAQSGDEMIARRLDTKAANNLKYFTFTGAEHTMELGIVKTGYQDSHRRCIATISYAHFVHGTDYTLTETSAVGGGVAVSLIDGDGKVLVREANIPCL